MELVVLFTLLHFGRCVCVAIKHMSNCVVTVETDEFTKGEKAYRQMINEAK